MRSTSTKFLLSVLYSFFFSSLNSLPLLPEAISITSAFPPYFIPFIMLFSTFFFIIIVSFSPFFLTFRSFPPYRLCFLAFPFLFPFLTPPISPAHSPFQPLTSHNFRLYLSSYPYPAILPSYHSAFLPSCLPLNYLPAFLPSSTPNFQFRLRLFIHPKDTIPSTTHKFNPAQPF